MIIIEYKCKSLPLKRTIFKSVAYPNYSILIQKYSGEKIYNSKLYYNRTQQTSEIENYSSLDKIPSWLRPFYKKCLSKNESSRTTISELQEFIMASKPKFFPTNGRDDHI